jgi:1-acyl-sn-glycerol-3-phosphate acyltransferase
VRWTLIFPLQRIFVKLGVTGRENLPPGPLLLAANHQSILDVPVILRALPWRRRGWVATAAGWEFHSPWRLFLTRLFFHTYPITADAAGAQSALRHAGALADEGFSTLIFPEGRRTPDGRVHEFRAGIGVLAASLRLPVVPVRLDGLYEIWPAGRWPRPGVARVTFGPPLWPEEGESAAGFTARLAGVLAATPAPAGQS